MPLSARVLGLGFWLACACGGFLPGLAAADESWLVVDLDGDGRSDRVVLDAEKPSVLYVWLSASKSVETLQSDVPLQSVAATDIDGDHRPDLVARDSESRIHVWVHRRKGFVKFRPREPVAERQQPPGRRHVDEWDREPAAVVPGTASPSILERTFLHLPTREGARVGTVERTPTHRYRRAAPRFAPRPPPAYRHL